MLMILGAGRSGTTFIAKLFDSHPRVLYRHEPDWLLVDTALPFQPRRADIAGHLATAERYLAALAQARSPKVAVHVPFFAKTYRGPWRQRLFESVALAGKALARLPGVENRLRVPDLMAPAARDVVTVMKSVNSLNRARLFLDAAAGLRIVHIVRHPCGVVASKIRGSAQQLMKTQVFMDSLYRMEGVEQYGIARADLERFGLAEQLAFQWMVTNDRVIADTAGHPRCRLVRYEDLCREPRTVLRELFEFAGLDWNDQTEAFIASLEDRDSATAAYFSVLRAPAKAAFKWREELATTTVESIRSITGRAAIGALYAQDY